MFRRPYAFFICVSAQAFAPYAPARICGRALVFSPSGKGSAAEKNGRKMVKSMKKIMKIIKIRRQ